MCEIRDSIAKPNSIAQKEFVEEVEPLAADVRSSRKEKPKELKHFALLRMLAVIHGCKFDDLRQRHQERATKRLMQIAVAALALMGIMAALAVYAFVQQQEATAQKEVAQLRDFDSRQRLSSIYVAEGWRQVDVNSPQLAIPYFLQGFIEDPRQPKEKIDHRIRLSSLISSVPSPRRILLGDKEKVVLSIFPDAIHALVRQSSKFYIVDLETNQRIKEFSIPDGFRFMTISKDGQFLLGINSQGGQVKAQVFSLDANLSLTFESNLDVSEDEVINLIRFGDAVFFEQQSAVVITTAFMSLRGLYIAQNIGSPAVAKPKSFPSLMDFSLTTSSPLIALSSRAFDDEIRFWDLRTSTFSSVKIPLKAYSTVDVLQHSSSGRELAVVQSSKLIVYQIPNARVLTQYYSRVFGVNKVMFTGDDTRIVLLGIDGVEAVQKRVDTNWGLRSTGFARLPVFDGFNSDFAIRDSVVVVATLSKVRLLMLNEGLISLAEIHISNLADSFQMSEQTGDALRIKMPNKIESWNTLNVGNLSSRINPKGSYPVGLNVDNSGDVSYLDLQSNRLVISEKSKPKLYDLNIGKLKNLFVSPDSSWLAVASSNNQLKVADKTSLDGASMVHDFEQTIIDVQFSIGKQFVLVTTDIDEYGERGTLHGWAIGQPSPTWSFELDQKIAEVLIGPAGNYVFLAGSDRIVVLDLATGTVENNLDHENILTMGIGGELSYLVSASPRTIKIWNRETYELVTSISKDIDGPYASATMIPVPGENKFVAKNIGIQDHMRVFDLFNGEPLSVKMQMADEGKEKIERFELSPNGKIVAAIGSAGSLRTWSTVDGNLLTRPFKIKNYSIDQIGNFIQVRELKFSGNESWLVTIVNNGAFLRSLYPLDSSQRDLVAISNFLSRHKIDEVGELVPLPLESTDNFNNFFEQ